MAVNIVEVLSLLFVLYIFAAMVTLLLYIGVTSFKLFTNADFYFPTFVKYNYPCYSSFFQQYQIWRFYTFPDEGCLQLNNSK